MKIEKIMEINPDKHWRERPKRGGGCDERIFYNRGVVCEISRIVC